MTRTEAADVAATARAVAAARPSVEAAARPSVDAAARPLRKDAARNRALLIEAGRVVFAERGLDASLDDVARRAGVGVGTAYRHFGNKHELARAIFAQAVEGMVDLAHDALRMRDPWQGLVSFIEGAATAQGADRGLREVMNGLYDPEATEQISERLGAPVRDLVARAKDAGELRSDVEVSDVGIAVLMLCTVADVTEDVAPQLWRRYLPMLLDGLRPGVPRQVPPISEDELRSALGTYKQRLYRGVRAAETR